MPLFCVTGRFGGVTMSVVRNLGLEEFGEWMEGLGLLPADPPGMSLRERLRDGIFLCQLVNMVRPGAVEDVSGLFSLQ